MRLSSVRARALVLVLLAGCEPKSHSVRERLCAGSGCTAACRDVRVDACDIRDRACLDVIFQSLQCVRGAVLDERPRLRLTNSLLEGKRETPDQAEQAPETASPSTTASVRSGSAPSTSGSDSASTNPAVPGPSVPPPPQPSDVFAYYVDEGLKLLHFIPEPTTIDEVVDKEKEVVGAIQTGGEVFVEQSNVGHRWLSMQLVAHEFVHAQQEVDYGGIANLYTYYDNTTTSRQAIRALIEGEAELYALLTHAFMRETSTEAWALLDYFDEHARQKRREIASVQAPWTHADWWLHYSVGARVLAERWQSGGNLAVRAVHHNLQADFGAWVRNLAPSYAADLGRGKTCAPARTQVVVRDELGPSGVFALLMAASKDRALKPIEPAWQVARGLVDDKLEFFAPLLNDGETQSEWFVEAAKEECRRVAGQREAGANDDFTADAGVEAGLGETSQLPNPYCSDAGVAQPNNATDDDEYARLLPQGSVWLSWRLAFSRAEDASRFVEYFEGLDWRTLEVTRDDAKVLLKGYREPLDEAGRRRFESWDPWRTCADQEPVARGLIRKRP